MNTVPRIFGQAKPILEVSTNLLTVNIDSTAQVNLFVANQAPATDYFSIELIPLGGNDDLARWIAYETPITGNGVFSVAGISLNGGDRVVIKTMNGTSSFTATGLEFTP